jgi:NitT/TauT family transport system ATP-binding protein
MLQPAMNNLAGAAALLQVDGVTLQYRTPERRVTATYRVDFDIQPGERLILLDTAESHCRIYPSG